MVQCGERASIFGEALPGARVDFFLNGEKISSGLADYEGSWKISIPPQKPGGPHELLISTEGARRLIQDVVFGEVWLASGQSNLQMPLTDCLTAEEGPPGNRQIRFFRVPQRPRAKPVTGLGEGQWVVFDGPARLDFSALGAYFAVRLQESLQRPVGIIVSAWGGTPIASWLPGSRQSGASQGHDPVAALAEKSSGSEEYRWKTSLEDFISSPEAFRNELLAWEAHRDKAYHNLDQSPPEAAPDFPDKDWHLCPVPGNFEEIIGDFDGEVWYRRVVEIPEAWQGLELELSLGVIDDLDHCFFEGDLIGQTPPDMAEPHLHFRRYRVPASLVRPGRRVLVVRLFDEFMSGGFLSSSSEIWLAPAGTSPTERLALSGLWKVRPGAQISPRPAFPGMPQMLPGVLFNGMIAPVAPYAVKGFLWYQGENDCGNANAYRSKFRELIGEWRALWGKGLLPFHFVQLAGYGPPREGAQCSALADLRHAQAAALVLPGTRMTTAVDLGDPDNLHPRNKAGVGERLARSVLSHVYGIADDFADGPQVGGIDVEGHGLRVLLRSAHDMRVVPTGEPLLLDVIQHDGRRIQSQAFIEGNTLLLPDLEKMSEIAEVRHAWAGFPRAHVVNGDGVALPPFRIQLGERMLRPSHAPKPRLRLAVRADDAGLSEGTNRAIAELCGLGVVRSVGIMPVGPAFEHAVECLGSLKGIQIGLHFALTCEWKNPRWGPLSRSISGADWLEADGTFFQTTIQVYEKNPLEQEVYRELEAQYDRLTRAGLRPDYIDDHMGCCWIPGVRAAVSRFAIEQQVFFHSKAVPGLAPDKSVSAPLSENDCSHLLDLVATAEPGDYLLVVHPAYVEGGELVFGPGVTDSETALAAREQEFWGLRSAELCGRLMDQGVELIGYSELCSCFIENSRDL